MRVESAVKYSDDEIKEIKVRYHDVLLKKNQIKKIRKEIAGRESLIKRLKEEIKDIKEEIMDDHDMAYNTLWGIGEGYTRRDVK